MVKRKIYFFDQIILAISQKSGIRVKASLQMLISNMRKNLQTFAVTILQLILDQTFHCGTCCLNLFLKDCFPCFIKRSNREVRI